MDTLNEIKYSLGKISSLGSYPFHLLLIIILYKLEMTRESVFLLLGFILVYLIGIPLRKLSFRKRKHLKNQDQFLHQFHVSSFPSFHSARAALLAFFLSNFFGFDMDVVVLSITLTILVSYSRIINKQHYLIDTIGGVALGVIIWITTWILFPI